MTAADLGRGHLSHSSLRQLQMCSMAWRLQRVDGVRPSHQSGSMIVGRVYHQVLAKCLSALECGEEVTDALIDEAFETAWMIETVADGPPIRWPSRSDEAGQRALCRLMVGAWQEQGLPGFTDCEILGIEMPFMVTIINSHGEVLETPAKGFIDVIVRDFKGGSDTEGGIVLIDHKTASQSYGETQIEMDLQASIYTLAARQLGFGDVAFEFHFMLKRKQPKLTIVTVNRSADDLDRLHMVASEAEKLIRSGIFLPTAAGWQCEGCEYKAACKAVHRVAEPAIEAAV